MGKTSPFRPPEPAAPLGDAPRGVATRKASAAALVRAFDDAQAGDLVASRQSDLVATCRRAVAWFWWRRVDEVVVDVGTCRGFGELFKFVLSG